MVTIEHDWHISEYLTEKEFHKVDELMEKGDFTKAISIFLVKIDDLKDNNELIKWVAYDLGCIYSMNDDVEKALLFFKKSTKLFDGHTSIGYAGVIREYAMILKDKKKWSKAINFYQNAKTIFIKNWINEEFPIDFAIFQTEMAESYCNLGMSDEALENCLEAKKSL